MRRRKTRTPADIYTVRVVIDSQELDSRPSTDAIYWEGLSEPIDSKGKLVGRGYLEMTGYASPCLKCLHRYAIG